MSSSNALVVYVGDGKTSTETSDSNSLGSRKKFVGLCNQGATCYMNSLLQTLYMTPEFRRALYKWHYNPEKDGEQELCIPLQLQKLFGMLQLSDSRAVDTKALTKSFGWEGNEVFQQQDVQELCRVLFDALEESFKGTEVENVIDDLYAGQHVDYVKCIDIDYQSERRDKFLDFSLAIKPFGSNMTMKSLNEAIEHYLQPEILDGDNQYFAESVGRKVDAIKGLKLSKLPEILSVQLKRFVFDMSGDNIVQKKINDQVSFPVLLDMNRYVSKSARFPSSGQTPDSHITDASNTGSEGHLRSESAPEVDEFEEFLREKIASLRGSKSATSTETDISPSSAVLEKCSSEDSLTSLPDLVDCNGNLSPDQIVEKNEKSKSSETHVSNPPSVPPPTAPRSAQDLIRARGEWVYELYAVLIHSGAISGGHYYVYIRDQDSGKWWNFNDSTVSEIGVDKVLEAWGGTTTYTNYYGVKSTTQSNANAYMLMYRKASLESSTTNSYPSDSMVPDYIRQEIEKHAELMQRQKAAEDEKYSMLVLKIHWKGKEHTINCNRRRTLNEVLQQIWTELNLKDDDIFLSTSGSEAEEKKSEDESTFPVNRLRLRMYNTYMKAAQEPYVTEVSGNMTLESLRIYSYRELLLEHKAAEAQWETYDPNAISLNLYEYNPATKSFKDQVNVRISRNATLGDLREYVKKLVPPDRDVSKIRFLKLTNWTQNDVRVEEFCGDHFRLVSELRIFESQKIYFEDNEGPLSQSPSYAAFSDSTHKIKIIVNHPADESFTNTISADRRWNLKQLREHIANVLNIDPNSFRMFRRYNKEIELNGENNQTLFSLGIHPDASIFLCNGRPLPPGHFNFKIFLYKAKNKVCLHNLEDVSLSLSQSSLPSPTDIPTGNSNDNINSDMTDELKSTELDDIILEPTEAISIDASVTHASNSSECAVASQISVGVVASDDCCSPKESTLTNADVELLAGASPGNSNISSNDTATTFGYQMVDMTVANEQFEFLMDLDVEPLTSLNDIRLAVHEKLSNESKLPEYVTSTDLIRVRQKTKTRVTTILRDGSLRENQIALYSNRELAIEFLSSPEKFPTYRNGDVIVLARRWHRSTWTLGDAIEVYLRGSMPVMQIAQRLSRLFEITCSKDVRVLIVTPYSEIRVCDLAQKNPQNSRAWINPMLEERALVHMVWHLNEGDLIIIQDESEPLRELSSAEKQSMIDAKIHMSSSDVYGVYSDVIIPQNYSWPKSNAISTPHREQGIHIKTHKEREKEKTAVVVEGGDSTSV